jgi:uncharacterized membrane protein YoaK (UPF0700 family)
MTRYDSPSRALAIGLSVLAGYVDAIGFLVLGGFFVSFMSGNSTQLSVALARGSGNAGVAGGLIGAFVLGVVLGAVVGRGAGRRRSLAVLGLVAGLLGIAPILAAMDARTAALGAVAVAMGVENNVFVREGEVSIGVTYMTGTLVKLGQTLARAVMGGEPLAWLPYLLLWLGLVAGAVGGAFAYPRLGLGALWLGAAGAAVLAVVSLGVRTDG